MLDMIYSNVSDKKYFVLIFICLRVYMCVCVCVCGGACLCGL